MKIILVNGLKRSGKDYFSNLLKERLENKNKTVEICSFADPMKFILSTTLNISIEELDNYKNNMSKILLTSHIEGIESLNSVTNVRSALQNFGTEAMQTVFGKNVWVDLMNSKIEKSKADYFIIPDFRFTQEYIDDAITVHIMSSDLINADTHKSENDLKDFSFDHIIDNTGKPNISPQIEEFIHIFL